MDYDYRWAPMGAINPELTAIGYGERELTAIARLGQLARSLADGTIGFEWYSYLAACELHAIGWGPAPQWGACGSPPVAG